MALAKKLKAARKTKRMTIAEILGGDSSTKNKKQPSSARSSDGEEIDPEEGFTPLADEDIKVNPWVVPEMTENPNEPQLSTGRRDEQHHDNSISPNRRTVNF